MAMMRPLLQEVVTERTGGRAYQQLTSEVGGQKNEWDQNYHEAAIYLKEGEENEELVAHPRNRADLPAYFVAHSHSTWCHIVSFCAALLLLPLACFESSAVPVFSFTVPVAIHATVELLCLFIIGIELLMKIKWIGLQIFTLHFRTLIKTVVLVIMLAEAITVIVRQQNHFRVTRALRPVFILDSPFCIGVRRFIQQILQSLPAVFEMLGLLLFFILLFSVLGFYLFSEVPGDTYFSSIHLSFINLFILLTTANFPDVMMPAYKNNHWASSFFIIYISLELFLFMNLFQAVVFSVFLKIEKDKLRKLLLHRRHTCALAFKLLVTRENLHAISVRNFAGCMQYFRPRMSKRDIYLTFKCLNVSRTGKLTEEEFMNVFEATTLKWQKRRSNECWSAAFRPPWNSVFNNLHKVASSRWFEYFIYCIILLNFAWIVADTIYLSVMKSQAHQVDWADNEKRFLWCSIVFVVIYVTEAAIKILGLGPWKYFSSGWNVFDFIVTVVALLGLILEAFNFSFYYVVVLRPLRVLRLFKLKSRFRDIFGTLFLLFSRMMSLAVGMLLLYYFFAIIGMEVFGGYTDQMMNCCRNTSVEQYYKLDNVSLFDGYYYLNTFENLLVSGVTLFELTVVNNWWIIMEGYATVVSGWTRIYFMIFYLIVMIVMAVVIAFVIEAFIFRIQYHQTMQGQNMEDNTLKKVDVPLSPAELEMCTGDNELTGQHILRQNTQLNSQQQFEEVGSSVYMDASYIWFHGTKSLGKYDFSLKMYSSEVQEWIAASMPPVDTALVTLEPTLSETPT